MWVAREDACRQRQLMNLMMMAMLSRNQGENNYSTPPLALRMIFIFGLYIIKLDELELTSSS
jgi:hypothetical protein